MDIIVKKCDRCGKIYNLGSRKEINNKDHYETVLTYEENGRNVTEFFDIFDPMGRRLDLCFNCARNLDSFVHKKEDE